ncbi:MAG TPA: ABC transporter substrate-binding protein [Burkholderiales bacterium]|jgi:branched-chain amino acid transport system substrate-binding protein|nr:ABC transporter substrate-binding protein [Burkholderiales bacterium]
MKKEMSVLRRLMCASVLSLITAAAFAQSKEPFTFGVALPTTGSAAPFGLDQIQALEWAVADINARGGAGGRKLNAVVLDTQARPQVGIDVVTRLISVEKVPLVITAFSAVVAAVAPIANRANVLTFVIGANSPRIANMGDYVYTTYPLADVDVTLLAKYARQELKKSNAAVLYLNDESGVYGARVFRENFEKLGGRIVANESYEPNSTDYTGAILKIRAANPELVHLQGNAGDSPQAIAQLRQLGVKVPITSYTAAYNPQMAKQLGTQADGLIVASLAPGVADSPAVAAYVERWKKEKGREPNNVPVTQYLHDGAYIIKALVEHLDKTNRPLTGENLRKALLEVKTFKLPLTGEVTINENHTVLKPVYLLEVKGGVFTPLRSYQ